MSTATKTYITENDLNNPTIKKHLLASMNTLLEMGATLKRCQDSGWQDGSSWCTTENATYCLQQFYKLMKTVKPSIDVKVYVDSTDHRSGDDYVDCKCADTKLISVDEPAKCVCNNDS
jgi:hypothetical protein